MSTLFSIDLREEVVVLADGLQSNLLQLLLEF